MVCYFTARKRSLGQGNIFAPVCHSVHRGGVCSWGVWSREGPPDPHPRGKLRGITSRPTPKGEIEGDQIQAHTQGGHWGGSDPGPHPRGKLRGIRSRPTPTGEIEGDQVQPPDDYCCGRYASYWNAFLFSFCSVTVNEPLPWHIWRRSQLLDTSRQCVLSVCCVQWWDSRPFHLLLFDSNILYCLLQNVMVQWVTLRVHLH